MHPMDPMTRPTTERDSYVRAVESPVARTLLLSFGVVCAGVGMIGVIIPPVPTAGLLLVALWAFARSSRRFHDWLFYHRHVGPYLRLWVRHRAIERRAKIGALVTMVLSLGIVHVLVEVMALRIGLTVALLALGLFVATRNAPPADWRETV